MFDLSAALMLVMPYARRSLIAFAAAVALSACQDSTSPASGADFVVEDIRRFWEAVDAGANADAFQARYLAPASPALKQFIVSRTITGSSLSQMVRTYPRYFAAIRANTLALGATSPTLSAVSANYTRMKQLYAKAVTPQVTFVIGRFSTGGTAVSDGIIIGMEFYSSDAATPLDELSSFARTNVKPASAIPMIIAHENVHVQQLRFGLLQRSARTVLERSLLEGSADFIGELVAGGHINQFIHAWALPREAAIWQAFKADMDRTDISRWLYNQQSSTPDWPGDLGYFVGYRIAKAFYDRASDKSAAIRDIIQVRDASVFLEQSGYAPTTGGLPNVIVEPRVPR
ncbi:MAG: DUF2268 domain-containing putative Zn-dependent protease [Gemmatimonadaceae bacterium]